LAVHGRETVPSEAKALPIDQSGRQDRIKDLAASVPGLEGVMRYMTPDELAKLSKRNAQKIVDIFSSLPDAKEWASVAYAGRAKWDWYVRSAHAIVEIFGIDDAPRFAALLAATSPRTTIQANAVNTLKIWINWDKAGRPLDKASITRIMGESVRGNRLTRSVLPSWIPNAVAALSHPDPVALKLSGPKVSSFAANLRGIISEVTLDTWMAIYANVPQELFRKSGKSPGKGPGYIATAARVREAADVLSRMTGETWSPAEVQVSVWSWTKTLYEKADRAGENRTALQILKAGDLTDNDIAGTPDFALLFTQGVYRKILERAGYGEKIETLARTGEGGRGADGTPGAKGNAQQGEGSAFAGLADERELARAAARIDQVRAARAEGGEEVKAAGSPQNSIPEATKAADQAALSHPEQAAPSGDPPTNGGNDGKVRSSAAAGLVATGLAAAGIERGEGADNDPNPLKRIMQSRSAAARDVVARLLDDPRSLKKRFEDVDFDASAQTLMKDWNGGLKRALNGTNDAFTEHWKAAGALDQREFNEAVGRALRNGGEADDPQVARATRLWRSDVFGPITDAAVKAGLLPEGVEPAAAGSYFSRIWSRSKLFAMEREFKETVAQYFAERMVREQMTSGRTDVRANAREITDDLFDTLTGRSDSGLQAGQDHSVHIPDALAAPFLEDNVELIGRRLVRSIGADLELAQKFGTPDMADALVNVRAGYEKLHAQATDDNERLALTRAEQRDIADLEAARDLIRGLRIDSPIERNYARIVRAAQRLDAIGAAGEIGLPSLPDAVRPAMVQGLSTYMQTVDRLAADLEAVRLPSGEAALAGRVGERVLAHRLSALTDIDDPYAARTPADAFLQKMTDANLSWNGIRIFADMQKSFAAVMVQDCILKAVREGADISGIGEPVAAQIAGQFEKHGREIEGVRVGNTQAWDKDDAAAAALRVFRAAVNKGMGGFIAKGTPTGEAMLALKNFALASWQRLLLRRLDAKAERFMGGLIAKTAMGMFAAWAASPDIASDPERWIGEGFDRSGIMAVPMELSDAFEKATGFDPLGPLKSPESGTRLLPFNAYPGIRQMLGYALHSHN
jgi:hypothetical protein